MKGLAADSLVDGCQLLLCGTFNAECGMRRAELGTRNRSLGVGDGERGRSSDDRPAKLVRADACPLLRGVVRCTMFVCRFANGTSWGSLHHRLHDFVVRTRILH